MARLGSGCLARDLRSSASCAGLAARSTGARYGYEDDALFSIEPTINSSPPRGDLLLPSLWPPLGLLL